MAISTIGIYCGSSNSVEDSYKTAAQEAGEAIARAGLNIVYGGGSNGLMGAVAEGALAHGGNVIGVMPKVLENFETPHPSIHQLILTPDMHTRKAKMSELADAFLMLPGGVGTLEEFFEAWTWRLIGIHNKPCAILNSNGFYDQLVAFIEHGRQEHFIRTAIHTPLIIESDIEPIISRILAAQ